MTAQEQIRLEPMTREACHALFRGWENDPAIYADLTRFKPYVYDPQAVDRYFDAKQTPARRLLAVMLGDKVIGEVQLKRIDPERRACELSIHLQNDSVKGLGYGTQAERLAVRYAFEVLGLETVFADAIVKNTRSQHTLEKAGFRFLREENGFRYYRWERAWGMP